MGYFWKSGCLFDLQSSAKDFSSNNDEAISDLLVTQGKGSLEGKLMPNVQNYGMKRCRKGVSGAPTDSEMMTPRMAMRINLSRKEENRSSRLINSLAINRDEMM